MKTRRSIIITALIFFMAFFQTPLQAGIEPALQAALPSKDKQGKPFIPAPRGGRVVMVVVDRLGLSDLKHLPYLQKLEQQGALGLMNGNTAGALTPENTYATIGAGVHVTAYGTASLGFNARERFEKGTAAEEFYRRTGMAVKPGALVQLGIVRIHRQNQQLPYPAIAGALGSALHKAGLKTAVLGNADVPQGLRRQALNIAMDEKGVVDYGNVGTAMLASDPSFPGGLRTDYEKLLHAFDRLPPEVSLAVLELGDLSRLEEMHGDVLDKVMEKQRRSTLERVDQFIGELASRLDPHRDLLLILSPTPGKGVSGSSNYLTPIMAVGAGVTPGILSSPTTKRAGVVMNTDIAPTVLHFLRIGVPGEMTGQPMRVTTPEKGQIGLLERMLNQLSLTYNIRPNIQKGYIFYQLILLLVSLYCIFWRRTRLGQVLEPFLLSVMVVPLAYLLLPLLPQPTAGVIVLEILTLTVLVTTLTVFMHRRWRLDPFIFLCFANGGLILLDAVLGGPLQKTAIMGYDPIVGARFYGIGNEYMGILIGSMIIGSTALLTRLPHWRKPLLSFTGVIYLVTIYVLAAPQLGTNVGGTIAAAGAFFTTFLLLTGRPLTIHNVIRIGLGAMAVLVAFMIYDLHRPPWLQSHIGRNTALVLQGGWPVVVDIIQRKSELNIKLVRYTIWSRIFLASLGSLVLLFHRPVGVMAAIRSKYPDLFRGFVGVTTASILALIFNDSGIVAAATTMVFGAPPMVYLVLKEISEETPKM
ncbi:hypothetical protein Desku_1556 [Desulfofundulus kuznetsovii DSM 6115]|uniref:Type I phosphodiesterase/nucleotide pyrophosphatase n=1 Tax=Desulfofundulus kuznetsovii (strain DSM 6115 / VKM B-1805 / 17) TaxID=760568 RepID=A0AAU8PAP2_DESK7|nr:hypothetical protein Desku_1556 [Desulfofundulus kuznetsovii DSM 6115]